MGRQVIQASWAWLGLLAFGSTSFAADVPSVKVTMQFVPRQRDIEIETPLATEFDKCKVDVERRGKLSGWVVYGAAGQVLRRFVDTDNDNQVDQWRYYQHGIEVYRDIDTNRNNKPDQYRWLNLGGSRWGIDQNEDGKVDQWRSLSASEASREAVQALVAGDVASLQTLMVTADDLKSLGIASSYATKLLESANVTAGQIRTISTKSKVLKPETKWMRFDAQTPSVIPADEGKASQDLYVYENAMVVVEPGPSLIQIGEMVRVGEVWKLTQIPLPIEGSRTIASGGILMQPGVADAPGDVAVAPSPELQKLVEELQALDKNQPALGTASRQALSIYNARRADLLLKMLSLAGSEEEKAQFLKQCVDGLAAAVQTDAYPEGLARIKKLESELRQTSGSSPVLPYITYRRIMSDYSVDMKDASADERAKVQEAWLTSLTTFVKDHPTAEDTSDAMLQLAVAEEFAGKLKEATNWYRQVAQTKASTPAADKARGAIRRLELKGQPFVLSGASLTGGQINTADYRGKALLVFYWATWCQPCKEDLAPLRALYQQYRSKGFEVVGVCLDIPVGTPKQQQTQLMQFLTENKVPWPQMFEPGGLDSAPAVQYGIISLPTMFLVDQKGEVVSRNSSVDELKSVLPQLLGGK